MVLRTIVTGAVLLGMLVVIVQPLLAQPDLGVPFTYECIVWKEEFDPLPARAQRAIFSAIGSVVFAGVVAVVDLKEMLDLPFDPKMVVIGFFGLGLAASLADYWFTNAYIDEKKAEGATMGCIEPQATFLGREST